MNNIFVLLTGMTVEIALVVGVLVVVYGGIRALFDGRN